MNFFPTIIVLIGTAANVYGLKCFSCYDSDYNGESTAKENCFSPSTTTIPATRDDNCSADTSSRVYYCKTQFTITDGVVTGVTRGCIDSKNDEDVNTDDVPANEKCVTQLSGYRNPTDTTHCYYHCKTDHCNSKIANSLIPCKTSCNGGRCDYITGQCVCDAGRSGANCSASSVPTSTARRKCLQCNSATDSSCNSTTPVTDCPNSAYYCSTATTSIYDKSDRVISTLVTRGCTSTFLAVDECSFTDIYADQGITSSGYSEFTCYSTCDTDGCNKNNANGVIDGDEAVLMECVQCTDTQGSGRCDSVGSKSICPSGTTHCKSTVVYHISEKVDSKAKGKSPAYKLISVVRECATAAAPTKCTESSVGSLTFKKVTCTETCQEDGCNTGWPARPKCSSCSSHSSSYGYDTCLENPPSPSDCSYPYQAYCFLIEYGIDKGTKKSLRGYPHIMNRGCTYYDMGTGCTSQTPRSTEIETCKRTCTTDGCNVGSGSLKPSQTFASMLVALMIGWTIKLRF